MNFQQKLRKLMEELHLNKKQFSDLTGVPKGTVRDWLEIVGRDTSVENKLEIAEKLGIDPNYFFEITPDKPTPVATSNVSLTPKEASKYMETGIEFVHHGLQQGKFPWGYAVCRDGHWSYWINSKKFFEIEGFQPFQSPKMG